MKGWARWLQWAPVAALVAVAATQPLLVQREELSPWCGGGFGMFSTPDAGGARHLHAYRVGPGLIRELRPPDALRDGVERALTLPSERRLRELAARFAALPTPDIEPATAIRLQVWRTRFDSETLAPSGELVRGFDFALPLR